MIQVCGHLPFLGSNLSLVNALRFGLSEGRHHVLSDAAGPPKGGREGQRAPNPPKFAHPRLSRVKGRSSPARGYKIWVCLFLYGRS